MNNPKDDNIIQTIKVIILLYKVIVQYLSNGTAHDAHLNHLLYKYIINIVTRCTESATVKTQLSTANDKIIINNPNN